MEPLFEKLAKLVGQAIAERWMKVLARRHPGKFNHSHGVGMKRIPRNQGSENRSKR
jgi:hypothetical protein